MTLQKAPAPGPLRAIALQTLAARGIEGTTMQHVADEAGCTKSNILYHFESKAGMVAAVLEPAAAPLAELARLLAATIAELAPERPPIRWEQAEETARAFVDALLEHRLEAYLILNHIDELPRHEVLDRIQADIAGLATLIEHAPAGIDARVRIGIALGGAAFALAGPMSDGLELADPELRRSLVAVVAGLLVGAPAPASASAPGGMPVPDPAPALDPASEPELAPELEPALAPASEPELAPELEPALAPASEPDADR